MSSSTTVPTNLLKPAVVFSSLTFIFAMTVIFIMIGVTLSVPSTPAIIPGVPTPINPTPVTPPALRNRLGDVNNSSSAVGIAGATFSILSIVSAFLTLCMVWAMHAQRSK